MTGAALFPSHSLRRRAIARLRLALAASAAGHLLIAAVMVTETSGAKPGSEPAELLTVRLAPQSATENTALTLPDLEAPVSAQKVMQRSPVVGRTPRMTAAMAKVPAPQDSSALLLPPVPDSTYYDARDLDVYPRPVAPLELDRIADGIAAPGRVAVTLQIDEQGVVSSVAFTGPAAPDELKEGLRAVLAATQFLPARKNGRAVRSRLTLSVDFTQEKREP